MPICPICGREFEKGLYCSPECEAQAKSLIKMLGGKNDVDV